MCHESVACTRHNGDVAPRTKSSVSRVKERTQEITRAIAQPTPKDARIGRSRSTKAIVRTGGLLVGLAAMFALFIIPITDFIEQREALAKKTAEFEALADANEELQNEVNDLSTPEGIRNAARTQLGYVLPGEQKLSFAQTPLLPTTLPDQWPYTMVTSIVAVRTEAVVGSGSALQSRLP